MMEDWQDDDDNIVYGEYTSTQRGIHILKFDQKWWWHQATNNRHIHIDLHSILFQKMSFMS